MHAHVHSLLKLSKWLDKQENGNYCWEILRISDFSMIPVQNEKFLLSTLIGCHNAVVQHSTRRVPSLLTPFSPFCSIHLSVFTKIIPFYICLDKLLQCEFLFSFPTAIQLFTQHLGSMYCCVRKLLHFSIHVMYINSMRSRIKNKSTNYQALFFHANVYTL